MKTILSLISAILLMCFCNSAFAAQAYFDWGNDMDIRIQYNESSDNIEAVAAIRSETNQNDQFSLGIYVDGREYRKFFKYDSLTKILYVDFEIPQDLKEDTTIFLSIKDAQYNEVYTTIPANYNFTSVSRNDNQSVVSSFGSSTSQKDYGIFSMQVSTSSKQSVAPTYTHTSVDTKRQNISDLTRAELIKKIESNDFTAEEISEIKASFEKHNISTNDFSIQQQDQEMGIGRYYGVQGDFRPGNSYGDRFIPGNSSRFNEKRVINGIGNNPYSKSWRATQ